MSLWEVIGLAGNIAFFSRFFVQWWASERAGRSVAPVSFWWLSLVGTALLGSYTFVKGEPFLLFSFAVNSAVYGRNLWLCHAPKSQPVNPLLAAGLGVAAAIGLLASGHFVPRAGFDDSALWIAIGAVGTAIWSTRFLLQWWVSERAGESQFPRAFWWLSLVGNALLLAYALHLWDMIYILGFVPGPLVQVRNLMLGKGPPRTHPTNPSQPEAAHSR